MNLHDQKSTWIEFAQLQEELSDQTELDNFVEYIDDRSSTCVEPRIIFRVQYFIPSQNKHF